jgi:hypothetical protein
MSEPPPEPCGRVFRYTTVGCEILIFGLVGWFVGPYIFGPNGEILGTLIGALAGTLMMFLTLFYLAGMFQRKSRQENKKEADE